jgi:hypothetical protein
MQDYRYAIVYYKAGRLHLHLHMGLVLLLDLLPDSVSPQCLCTLVGCYNVLMDD